MKGTDKPPVTRDEENPSREEGRAAGLGLVVVFGREVRAALGEVSR